jgi:pimeloyl-ACP methyl ester carboxylesterase
MKTLFFVAIATLVANIASAGGERIEKFVKITAAQELYVDYIKAAPGKPTLVLLNGLTYSARSWDSFVRAFEKLDTGVGLLRYDMLGMGKTLLNDELPVHYAVPHATQVTQLKALLDKLGIKKASLLGLSYGGGIAVAFANQYPRYVDALILMAPFTKPLEKMDNWIKMQVSATRAMNPWNPATDDELYDFFLHQFVYTTYPSAEPIVLENPYKLEAIFRMVQGIRKFSALENLAKIPARSVHLIVAKQDQYIPKEVMDELWNKLPAAKKMSQILIDGSEHKIPEAIPAYSSAWVAEIMKKNAKISGGRNFQGSVRNGSATSGNITIELPRQ